jgi:uncharacterized protein (TIGR00266 family)
MSSFSVELRAKPVFAHIVAKLAPGATIVAESGAMASMSGNVQAESTWNGGLLNALLLKFFAKESLFVNRFTAQGASGELVLTQATPGDIVSAELAGQELCLTQGSFIACTPEVNLGVAWAGFSSWLAGEGLFRLKASGRGTVWFGGYGSVEAREVGPGLIVDTGHLVAYDPTLSMRTRLSGGIFSSFFSGEGLVLEVTGPGKVYLQSRSMGGLASWVNSHLFGSR